MKLNHVDSTFVSELTIIDGEWRIIPIGPSRRPRVDRYSFTAASSTSAPYLFRAEPKWARTYDGKKIFAKWISPILTFRVAEVAGRPTAFNDTLTQIYLNVVMLTANPYSPTSGTGSMAIPKPSRGKLDSMMRLTELAEVGAKFTKMAYYAEDDAPCISSSPSGALARTTTTIPCSRSDHLVHGRRQARRYRRRCAAARCGSGALSPCGRTTRTPFNPSTEITFTLPAGAQTTLRVYNMPVRKSRRW